MPSLTREASFAMFATDQRPKLQGVAYLLHADVQIAKSVVDASLAQLYDLWPLVGNAEDAAFRRLVHARPGELDLPRRRSARFELIDRASGRSGPTGSWESWRHSSPASGGRLSSSGSLICRSSGSPASLT